MAQAFTTGMKGPEAVEKLNALYLRVGIEYKGDWSPAYDYTEGDLAFNEGTTWRRSSPGGVAPVKPSTDTGWTIFARGGPGPANVLDIGTVTSGVTPSATITGVAPAQTLNLVLAKGDSGAAATVAVGTVVTGAPGSAVIVNNSGTPAAAVFDFTIPKGADGLGNVASVTASLPISSSGGANPNISIGAATTSAAGTMSAADKTKLNGVETGAQVNPTLKTINGASLVGGGNIALAGLGANTFTGDQIASDQKLSRAMTVDCGVVFLDKGNSGTSAQTLDYTAGSHQKITATGAFTLSTSNWPPSGNLGEMLLELVNGAAFAVTWPTINWVKSDGSFTTIFSGNGVTLQATGTDFCLLWSRDGGATIYGKFMR